MRKMTTSVLLLLCLDMLSVAQTRPEINSFPLSPKIWYNLNVNAYGIHASDIDVDGHTDILVGHNYTSSTNWGGLTIMTNSGDGTFVNTQEIFLIGMQDCVQATPLFYENLPDLVSMQWNSDSNSDSTGLAVLTLNDEGYFHNYYYMGRAVNKFILADINQDGHKDALFISNQYKYWGILYNDGNGAFGEPTRFPVNAHVMDIACGDLNGDGRNDVVLTLEKLTILYNLPGGFSSAEFEQNTFYIKLFDFNNDGHLDIIGISYSLFGNEQLVHVFENLENNSFATHSSIYFQPAGAEYNIYDINNDGYKDIVIMEFVTTQPYNWVRGIRIFYNQGGSFDFTQSQFVPLYNHGELSRKFTCADFDGNGFLDIAFIRHLGSGVAKNLEILFNDGNGNFLEQPVGIDNGIQKPEIALTNNPNPFANSTTFDIEIPEYSHTELSIHSLDGTLVTTLLNQPLPPGKHQIPWTLTGKDRHHGRKGVFLATVRLNGEVCKTIKIIVLN